jgi:hypothetical protein
MIALEHYKQIVQWAYSKSEHYSQTAIEKIMKAENADPFLVAYALYLMPNAKIVTLEKSEPNRKNSVKIPELCDHFGLKYLSTMELFRELHISF